MVEEEGGTRNSHYSEQTGHALRGAHQRVVRDLGGQMPESLPGFEGLHDVRAALIRRNMRRISRDGKR